MDEQRKGCGDDCGDLEKLSLTEPKQKKKTTKKTTGNKRKLEFNVRTERCFGSSRLR